MPLYEYECSIHGVFEVQRALAEAEADGVCPSCFQGSPRIVSATNLAKMARSQVKAIERNEQSRWEPKVVKTTPAPAGGRRPLRAARGYPWAVGHG